MYRQATVCMCECVCVCVFASTCVISLGQVSVCLPVSLYEMSVCPRNALRPICHWLLLFSSSNWCLEVELCCALASEKYVLFFPFSSVAQCICTCSWMKMWLGGKVLRMVNAFGMRMRGVQTCIEKNGKWIIKHHDQVECHPFQKINSSFDKSQSLCLASASHL